MLWRRAPRTPDEVVAALAVTHAGRSQPSRRCSIACLTRAREREGCRYLYAPILKREDWLLDESESLLRRLFDGRIVPLVAHFFEHRKLSKKDIAEFVVRLKLATLASSTALIVILLLRKPLRSAFGAIAVYVLWLLLSASLIGSLWPAREVVVALPTSQAVVPTMFGEAEFTAAAFDAMSLWFALWGLGGLSMLIAFSHGISIVSCVGLVA